MRGFCWWKGPDIDDAVKLYENVWRRTNIKPDPTGRRYLEYFSE
jgi:hypothetical protein